MLWATGPVPVLSVIEYYLSVGCCTVEVHFNRLATTHKPLRGIFIKKNGCKRNGFRIVHSIVIFIDMNILVRLVHPATLETIARGGEIFLLEFTVVAVLNLLNWVHWEWGGFPRWMIPSCGRFIPSMSPSAVGEEWLGTHAPIQHSHQKCELNVCCNWSLGRKKIVFQFNSFAGSFLVRALLHRWTPIEDDIVTALSVPASFASSLLNYMFSF